MSKSHHYVKTAGAGRESFPWRLNVNIGDFTLFGRMAKIISLLFEGIWMLHDST